MLFCKEQESGKEGTDLSQLAADEQDSDDNEDDAFFSIDDVESIVRREIRRSDKLQEDVRFLVQKRVETLEPPIPITSIHEITLFYWLPAEGHQKPLSTRILFMLASFVLLLCQCMIALAINAPTSRPPCFASDSCYDGQWCKADGLLCEPCMHAMKSFCEDEDDKEGFLEYYKKNSYVDADYKEACNACYRGDDDDAQEFVTERRLIYENLRVMGIFDWVAFVVTSVVVARSLSCELQDIFIARWLNIRLSVRGEYAGTFKPMWWYLHGIIRLHSLIPLLLMAMPVVTAYMGGSALNVCLNALSICLVADMDEYMVAFVPDNLKSEAMENAGEVFGEVCDSMASLLRKMKSFNLFGITLGIFLATLLGYLVHSDWIILGGLCVAILIPILMQFFVLVCGVEDDHVEETALRRRNVFCELLIILGEIILGFVVIEALFIFMDYRAFQKGYGYYGSASPVNPFK
jgi:hypothetical protein